MFVPVTRRGKYGSIQTQLPPSVRRTLAQGTSARSPLVGLKGAVGSSHIFRLLLMSHPHLSEDAGDAAGRTSCQWQGGLCSLGKGWILFSHLLEMSGSKEKPRVCGGAVISLNQAFTFCSEAE